MVLALVLIPPAPEAAFAALDSAPRVMSMATRDTLPAAPAAVAPGSPPAAVGEGKALAGAAPRSAASTPVTVMTPARRRVLAVMLAPSRYP